jgi:hypothetical protein
LHRICFRPISFYCAVFMLLLAVGPTRSAAQDKPYFVTYSHDLEDQGDLDIETKTALARPERVLYVEYEDISAADKTILEVVGHDGEPDLVLPNAVTKLQHQHEGELKLILSSDVRDWNISENFISEKNLGHAPWEFGYALGITHPLRSTSSERDCTFCAQKFIAGIEAYGGLGNTWSLTLDNTSHYIAPVVGWELPGHWRVSFSPGFGITGSSLDQFYRIGVVREFDGLGKKFRGGNSRVW